MTALRAGLTEAQLRAFNFIADHIERKGASPSYTEIAAAMNIVSRSGVSRIVDCLVERGYVTRLTNKNRSIAIVPYSREAKPLTAFDVLREETRRQLIAYCQQTGESPAAFIADAVSLLLDQRVADIDNDSAAVAEGLPTLHEAFNGAERGR